MGLATGAMSLAELETFLAANSSFVDGIEAINALNLTLVEDVGYSGVAYAVEGGAGQVVIGQVGETALDVAVNAALNASEQTVTSSAIGAVQTANGAKATAILGMKLGVVAAAGATIFGVAYGYSMYEDNPELWTKISQKLLPFCYPGTTTIPTWAEIVNDAWQVSLPKKVLDALKDLFIEEDIPVAGTESNVGTVTYNGETFPVTKIVIEINNTYNTEYVYNPDSSDVVAYCFIDNDDRVDYRFVSLNSFSVIRTITRTGVVSYLNASYFTQYSTKVYYRDVHITKGHGDYYPHIGVSPDNHVTSYKIASGVEDFPSAGEYQPGTSEWTGNVPSSIPESNPSIIGIDSTTGNIITQQMVPISPAITIPAPAQTVPEEITEIPFPWPEPDTPGHTTPWPTTMPWPLPDNQPDWWPVEIPYPYDYPIQYPSADPTEQPDPNTISDPDEQVLPYIMPYQYPWETEIPKVEVLPDADPTIPRDPVRVTTDYQDPSNPDIPPGSLVNLFPAPNGISPSSALPNTPLAFSGNIGLVTVYHPTQSQLLTFENWLWVTYNDATIDKIWNNPFDGVITLFEIYCTPNDVGTRNIHCGFLDSGINSAIVSRYVEIDCGTIGIPEFYGNYFDYSPYTQAHIYLPFIGIQELNADDIVGHAVNVKYRIDTYNGSCIAMITVAKVTELGGETIEYSNLMYQFSGNCAVELPLSGGSQASIRAGMMQADAWQSANQVAYRANLVGGIASALMGALTGSPGFLTGAVGAYANAVSGKAAAQANYLQNMLSGKSTVQKSGSFGSSCGALGVKIPYITITRPKQIQVPNYNLLYGYPAHKMVYIGDCEGYIRCREVHVISATATDSEKSMIEQLLKSGVYVNEQE